MRFRTVLPLALLLWVLAACTEPDTVESFIRREKASDGVYVFPVGMQDSTAAYDFWFYSRTERRTLDTLRLDIRWMSPAGESFAETVYMDVVSPSGSRELYRSGMVPIRTGNWQLIVRPRDTEGELLGLGLIYKKNHGTR